MIELVRVSKFDRGVEKALDGQGIHIRNNLFNFYLGEILKSYDNGEIDGGHDSKHIKNVLYYGGMLGCMLNANVVEMLMIKIAIHFHDLGLSEGKKDHEIRSAKRVRESALDNYLSSKYINIVSNACLRHRKSKIKETPKKERNLIDIAVCGADMYDGVYIERLLERMIRINHIENEDQLLEIVEKNKDLYEERFSVNGFLKIKNDIGLDISIPNELEILERRENVLFKNKNILITVYKQVSRGI